MDNQVPKIKKHPFTAVLTLHPGRLKTLPHPRLPQARGQGEHMSSGCSAGHYHPVRNLGKRTDIELKNVRGLGIVKCLNDPTPHLIQIRLACFLHKVHVP